MTLRKTIEVVTALADKGVIHRYAIAGAVAALNYIDPTLTEDLDILVSVVHFEKRQSGLILLKPIEAALAKMGYKEQSPVGIKIEGWPVQFLPAATAFDEEALERAIEIDVDPSGKPPLKTKCLTAEYVVATAISVGRPKDFIRAQAFLDQNAVNLLILKDVLERHNLMNAWNTFCVKTATKNPF
jgi:hypothetical protein